MRYVDLNPEQAARRRDEYARLLETTDCDQRDNAQAMVEAVAARAFDLTESLAEVEKLAAQMVIYARRLKG